MPIIVQCPACQKKMKIKEPTPGKKIRCPSCQEAFVPKAIGGGGAKPARKKRKPADEYDDFDDDYGDDYEEQPKRKSAAAAKGGKAAKGGSRSRRSGSKRKPPAATKSKTPLIVGLVVVLLAAAGGVTWALMGDGDSDTEVADAGADAGGDASGDASGAGGDNGESTAPAGGGGGEHGEDRRVASSGAGGSSVTPYQQTGPVDLSYMPATTEAVVKIDVGRLVQGPLGQLLQMEQVSGQLAMAEQLLGLTVQDIESVTVGVGGVSDAIKNGRPPEPTDLPVVVVLRTSVALDEAKLKGMIPGGQPVSENGVSYTRVPGPGQGPPAAVWFVDSNTVVAGIESVIQTVAPIPPQPKLIDDGMFDGKSPIQLVFSPSDPDSIFRNPQMQLPPQIEMPPAAKGMVETFLASATGAGIGVDLTNDLGFSLSVRCKDSGSANQLMEGLKAANEESKEQAQGIGFNPFAGLQKQLEDSQKMEVDGSMVRMSSLAEGGGQQLGAFMPMVVGMVQSQMMAGMAGGPGMGGPGMGMMGGPGMGGSMMGGPDAPLSTTDKMKNVALALHNFHDVYGRMPNAQPQGINHDGLSWRVHLLPFLGHQELYDQFDIDQAWDSPQNIALIDEMPDVYAFDMTSEPGKTALQVPASPGTLFESGRGRSMREVIDGTSLTAMLVLSSADKAVTWTQPADFTVNMARPSDGLGSDGGGYPVMLMDARSIVVDEGADPIKLRGLFTYRGGERVNIDELTGGGF